MHKYTLYIIIIILEHRTCKPRDQIPNTSSQSRCNLLDSDEKWMIKWCDLDNHTQWSPINPIVQLACRRKYRTFFDADEGSVVLEPLDE